MSNRFDPDTYPGARKGRGGKNKQGMARNHSQPLQAWKAISEAERRDLARRGLLMPDPQPAPRRRRRKTIKLWKDPAAVERGKRSAATKAANKDQRAAMSEHERRSDAARRGWANIPPAQRSANAERGWVTRDLNSGNFQGKAQRKQKRARRQAQHDYYNPF